MQDARIWLILHVEGILAIPIKIVYFMKGLRLFTLLSALSLTSAVIVSSCEKESTLKKTAYISDPAKVEMINSLRNLDGNGRLYELYYTEDYKLDKVLASGKTSVNDLFQYVAYLLYDELGTKAPEVDFGAGCSVFAVPERDGHDFLMGRNYDYRHSTEDRTTYLPTAAIIVHTAPEGGKKSISMVDGMHLGFGQGFYEEKDKDLSMMMALPYALLDGVNEDGFAIGVLALNETPAKQERNKTPISTTVAMRMLLDRASTVKEALDMLDEYDINMESTGRSSYHFFMADATGDYAIIEYTKKNPLNNDENPTEMEVLKGDDAWRFVTNFYASPSMADSPDGSNHSHHGKNRYDILSQYLGEAQYKINPSQAMELLGKVSQGPEVQISTGFTQWSEVFNLSRKTVKMSILREYDKTFEFTIEK